MRRAGHTLVLAALWPALKLLDVWARWVDRNDERTRP